MDYQKNYTDNPVAREHMYNEEVRQSKALKIVKVLDDYFGDISSLSILDISCSTGMISQLFSRHFASVTGIDIDKAAVEYARANNDANNVEFHVMDALNTQFAGNQFDVIVCNQMYEHVPDAQQMLAEINRLLVPGGVCYFGATNRLKVIETHYGRLPFLSWLPKKIANLYLRVLGKGDYYYENLYTYWTLKNLCDEFQIIDYTKTVIRDPERFSATDMVRAGSLQQKTALFMLNVAYWISPGYIWLLEKPAEN